MSSTLRAAAARLLSPAPALASGVPRCTTRTLNGIRLAMASAAAVSSTAACRLAASAAAFENVGAH